VSICPAIIEPAVVHRFFIGAILVYDCILFLHDGNVKLLIALWHGRGGPLCS
jgi:hypothetical protein